MRKNKFKFLQNGLISKLMILILGLIAAPIPTNANIQDFIRENGTTINNYKIVTYDMECIYDSYIQEFNHYYWGALSPMAGKEHHCVYILMNPYGELYFSLAPWIYFDSSAPARTVLLEQEDNGKTLSFPSGFEVQNYESSSGSAGDGISTQVKIGKVLPMLFNSNDSTISILNDKKIRFSVGNDYSLSLIPGSNIMNESDFGIGVHNTDTCYYEYHRVDGGDYTYKDTTLYYDAKEILRDVKFNLMKPQFYPKDCEHKKMTLHYNELDAGKETHQIEYENKRSPAYAVVQDETYYLMFNYCSITQYGTYETYFVIRGKINGNKVSFPSGQFATLDIPINYPEYLKCSDEQEYRYDYFCSTVEPLLYYEHLGGKDHLYLGATVLEEDMTFEYDPETLCLTGAEGIWGFHENINPKPESSFYVMSNVEVLEPRENDGVANVNDDTMVSVVDGRVILSRPGSMEVYSTDGRKVAADYGISLDLTTLGHGIFIVRAGDKTRKVRL